MATATVRLATRAAIFAGATLLTPACEEPAAEAPPRAVLSPASTGTATSATAPDDDQAVQGPKLEPARAAENTAVMLTPLPSTLVPTEPLPADTATADALAAAEAERVSGARSRRREAARLAAEERRRQEILAQQLADRMQHMNARPYGAPPRRDDFV